MSEVEGLVSQINKITNNFSAGNNLCFLSFFLMLLFGALYVVDLVYYVGSEQFILYLIVLILVFILTLCFCIVCNNKT